VAAIGIGRTYQTFELFEEMTVLANMMLARHVQLKYNVAEAFLFSKGVKAEEARQRQIVEELIDFLEHSGLSQRARGQPSHGHAKTC
jgi:branched-chain amino acid transport system ATP-binding protein